MKYKKEFIYRVHTFRDEIGGGFYTLSNVYYKNWQDAKKALLLDRWQLIPRGADTLDNGGLGHIAFKKATVMDPNIFTFANISAVTLL